MNIYLLSQTKNDAYDTYDSMVVVASSAREAIKIHPDGEHGWTRDHIFKTWCSSPEQVVVKLLGTAAIRHEDEPIILSSFNAG